MIAIYSLTERSTPLRETLLSRHQPLTTFSQVPLPWPMYRSFLGVTQVVPWMLYPTGPVRSKVWPRF